jgi:hypothetical protein
MAVTTLLLDGMLIHNISALVVSYLQPRGVSDYDVAKSGLYELCSQITDVVHGLDGACVG